MAEMTTDAQALSAAASEFDGIRYFFLFEDGSTEPAAGMQDTEKAVGGMFACTPIDTGEAATSIDRNLKSTISQVDSTAVTYFDGKFLTAHDLTREQVYLSDTGFDLV
jgi:hypothetical protein